MTPEQKARISLLRQLQSITESEGDVLDADDCVLVMQAINEIKDLADKLDFRTSDRLSEVVINAARRVLREESDGYEAAQVGPAYVDNNGFSVRIQSGEPGGFIWLIVAKREREDANTKGTSGTSFLERRDSPT